MVLERVVAHWRAGTLAPALRRGIGRTLARPGWFEDTLLQHVAAIGSIAVLRLDNDWYRSTGFCLETLYTAASRAAAGPSTSFAPRTACARR